MAELANKSFTELLIRCCKWMTPCCSRCSRVSVHDWDVRRTLRVTLSPSKGGTMRAGDQDLWFLHPKQDSIYTDLLTSNTRLWHGPRPKPEIGTPKS